MLMIAIETLDNSVAGRTLQHAPFRLAMTFKEMPRKKFGIGSCTPHGRRQSRGRNVSLGAGRPKLMLYGGIRGGVADRGAAWACLRGRMQVECVEMR